MEPIRPGERGHSLDFHSPRPGARRRRDLRQHRRVGRLFRRARFRRLGGRPAAGAVWLTGQLSRTVDTARAIGAGGYALPELAADARFGEQRFR